MIIENLIKHYKSCGAEDELKVYLNVLEMPKDEKKLLTICYCNPDYKRVGFKTDAYKDFNMNENQLSKLHSIALKSADKAIYARIRKDSASIK